MNSRVSIAFPSCYVRFGPCSIVLTQLWDRFWSFRHKVLTSWTVPEKAIEAQELYWPCCWWYKASSDRLLALSWCTRNFKIVQNCPPTKLTNRAKKATRKAPLREVNVSVEPRTGPSAHRTQWPVYAMSEDMPQDCEKETTTRSRLKEKGIHDTRSYFLFQPWILPGGWAWQSPSVPPPPWRVQLPTVTFPQSPSY